MHLTRFKGYITHYMYSCISAAFCEVPAFQGDGYCDDENNVPSCDYDGGDCCINPVETTYCTVCECIGGGNGGGGIATISPLICEYPQWASDGFCDDETNTEECDFDGGDCCLEEPITTACQECECHEIGTCMHRVWHFSSSEIIYLLLSDLECVYPLWVADGFCDDVTNTEECGFDGGDCCLEEINTVSNNASLATCEECICHEECNNDGGYCHETSTEDQMSSTITLGTTTLSNTGGISLNM